MPKEDKEVDLSAEVTVFVTTVGYPTFGACLSHLHAQDCKFRLEVIDHVAPMSRAFQRMLDECATPFYVQVDEDMLLYPHAVRTLYQRLSAMEESVVQYVCCLYDVHLERVIYGLKIFRHAVVRRYPFRDVRGCEWDQIVRFRADGYRDVRAPLEGASRGSRDTLGLHGTFWTPAAAYHRFWVLERTRRDGNRSHEWVKESAQLFLKRFLESRDSTDFYALMGVLAAALSEDETVGREKDYRRYGELPGLAPVLRFVEEAREGWSAGEEMGPGRRPVDVVHLTSGPSGG